MKQNHIKTTQESHKNYIKSNKNHLKINPKSLRIYTGDALDNQVINKKKSSKPASHNHPKIT